MKKAFFLLVVSCLVSCTGSVEESGPGADSRVEELLKKMTLAEKIGQMNQYSVGPNITGPSGPKDGRFERFFSESLKETLVIGTFIGDEAIEGSRSV